MSNMDANLRITMPSLSVMAKELKNKTGSQQQQTQRGEQCFPELALTADNYSNDNSKDSSGNNKMDVSRNCSILSHLGKPDHFPKNHAIPDGSTAGGTEDVESSSRSSKLISSPKTTFAGRIERVRSIQSKVDEQIEVVSKSKCKKNSKTKQDNDGAGAIPEYFGIGNILLCLLMWFDVFTCSPVFLRFCIKLHGCVLLTSVA